MKRIWHDDRAEHGVIEEHLCIVVRYLVFSAKEVH